MGKYLIRVESMDGDKDFDQRYADGIECDRFCIMADSKEQHSVAMHSINVDTMSKIIMDCDELLSAGILAKAKREIVEVVRKGESKKANSMLSRLLGME